MATYAEIMAAGERGEREVLARIGSGTDVDGAAFGVPTRAGGYTDTVTGTFTRPSNTTAYTANDGVTNATSSASPITIANAARVAGGSGIVHSGRLVKSTTGSTGATFRLWLYTSAPTAPDDNAAFSIAAAQKANRIGYIDFGTGIAGSDCMEFYGSPVLATGLPFNLASGTALYGILQATGAYAPGSGEVFDVYLSVLQD